MGLLERLVEFFMGCATLFKRFVMPLTSLMTVGVVSYISYAYLYSFIPVLSERHKLDNQYDKEHSGIDTSIILWIFFVPYPVLIFWALIAIVCGDPGFTTYEM